MIHPVPAKGCCCNVVITYLFSSSSSVHFSDMLLADNVHYPPDLLLNGQNAWMATTESRDFGEK